MTDPDSVQRSKTVDEIVAGRTVTQALDHLGLVLRNAIVQGYNAGWSDRDDTVDPEPEPIVWHDLAYIDIPQREEYESQDKAGAALQRLYSAGTPRQIAVRPTTQRSFGVWSFTVAVRS